MGTEGCAQTRPWRSKIVGYGEVPTESILANPQNWRIHPKTQQDVLSGVLETVGIVQNVLINKRTSEQWPAGDRYVETLCDGHLRVTLALRQGQESLPVTFVDLTPNEEALVLATLDPIAALAGADREQLTEVLYNATTSDAALMAFLSDLAEEHGCVPPDFQPAGSDEQGRLDEKAKVICPHCGEEFTLEETRDGEEKGGRHRERQGGDPETLR